MQYVVLAGGKGTRSKSNTAKILSEVEGETLLNRYVRELTMDKPFDEKNSILFLLGHYSSEIQPHLEAYKETNINVDYFVENKNLGTYGAMNQAISRLQEEFIVIMGDLYFDFDFLAFRNYARTRNANFVSVVHPNGHSFDSDVVELDPTTNRIHEIQLKGNKNSIKSTLSMAGIYYFKNCLHLFSDQYRNSKDIVEIFEKKFYYSNVSSFGYVTCEFIKDSGTPKRLQEIHSSILANVPKRRSRKEEKSAIFLDRDNTLLADRSEKIILTEDLMEEVSVSNHLGIPLIVITNQPDVAKGRSTIQEVSQFNFSIDLFLESEKCAFIDAWYWCPHHPETGHREETRVFKVNCLCRKPGIELFKFAAEDHQISLKDSYMIGDSIVDFQASKIAKIKFLHTSEFTPCKISQAHQCFKSTSAAIKFAREKIEVSC